MDQEQIIQEIMKKPWKQWLFREFDPFLTYIFIRGGNHDNYAREGVPGCFPIALYDFPNWYTCDEMFSLARDEAEVALQTISIFTIVKQCEDRLREGRETIAKLIADTDGDPLVQLQEVVDAIMPISVYIWFAHSGEQYYSRKLREAVKPYVATEELEKFIGDVSFPSKKNSLALMEDDIHNGVDAETLFDRYAWIKARCGFQPGYTLEEIKEMRDKIILEKEKKVVPEVVIPKEIEPLAKEVQELVYLRTLRTDAAYELLHRASPIFERVEKMLGIDSVKNYLPHDLIKGNLKRIPREYSIVKYYDDVIVTGPLLKVESVAAESLTGVTAQKGKVTGKVKVLYGPNDIHKVEIGDVLVSYMTIPAYITAMHRAAAFVTDEGGITCHAAILAREMKKPCIIATKIATKVFKDGDMVEVDADNGVVRKI